MMSFFFGRPRQSLVVLALMLVLGASNADAVIKPGFNPFLQECSFYPSELDFVVQAAYYCVRDRSITHCDRRAEKYFQKCSFDGDYKELSSKAYTEMLVVMVIGRTPELASPTKKRRNTPIVRREPPTVRQASR